MSWTEARPTLGLAFLVFLWLLVMRRNGVNSSKPFLRRSNTPAEEDTGKIPNETDRPPEKYSRRETRPGESCVTAPRRE